MCVSLATRLVARKAAFYTISEVNRIIRRCLFSDLGQNLWHFFPNFNHRIILQDKLHSFNIQDDRNTRLTNYKNNNIIKRFYLENSPLDGTVQSGQSTIM